MDQNQCNDERESQTVQWLLPLRGGRLDAAEGVSVRKTCLGEWLMHAKPRLNQASLCWPCDGAVRLLTCGEEAGLQPVRCALSSTLLHPSTNMRSIVTFGSLRQPPLGYSRRMKSIYRKLD